MLAPLAAISAGTISSYTGLGWIHLPTEGYWWYASLAFVVVALDLYKYTFHRLQHAIPFLWAMHSFHHSANAVTFITGARHFWLERVLTDQASALAAACTSIAEMLEVEPARQRMR